MIHYQLDQKVGDFTITAYNFDTNYYTLTCKCGNTSEGDSTHITRKISNLMAEGFTACHQCYYKYKVQLKKSQKQAATMYVYKDVYREYIKKAKERGQIFELSLEEAEKLFSAKCYYCNTKPSNKRTRDTGLTVFYQGIDRADNTKGYVTGNVVPCCKYCNFAKYDRSQEEFYKHIEILYNTGVQRLFRKEVEPSGSKQ